MALRTSSAAALALTISPLRTPRDRDWPRPMILRPPCSPISPMTAQIFDVPMSNPTMRGDELNMFFPVLGILKEDRGNASGSVRAWLDPARRHVVPNRQIKRRQHAVLTPRKLEGGLQARKLARKIV